MHGFATIQVKAEAYAKAADLKRAAETHTNDANARQAYLTREQVTRDLDEKEARRHTETAQELRQVKETAALHDIAAKKMEHELQHRITTMNRDEK
jgi:hypothetical protein